MQETPRLIIIVLTSFWNLFLFFTGFVATVSLSDADLYIVSITYILIGAWTFLWTRKVLMTILPAGVGFCIGFIYLYSLLFFGDTLETRWPSLSHVVREMGRTEIESLILAMFGATLGWFALRFLFRGERNVLLEKCKPFFFSLSVAFIVAWMVFSYINR